MRGVSLIILALPALIAFIAYVQWLVQGDDEANQFNRGKVETTSQPNSC